MTVPFGEEEPRSEREMAFDAKHKKAVASDAKLATTMAGSANFEDAERAEVNNMFYPKPEINLNVRAL